MREIVELFARVGELERRYSSTIKHGTVAEVDPGKQLVRLKMGGTDAEPFVGPWVPYAQIAGALKVHTPPSAGQQMTIFAPGGDFRQAVALPMTWSNSNPSPSDKGDEHVLTFGSVRIDLKGQSLKLTVGGVSLTISGDGFAFEGGTVKHDGHDIGVTHKHTDVDPGGGVSGPPE